MNAAQRVGHRVRHGLLAGERDQVNDHFGVAGGLEDRSLGLQPLANFLRVDQVAVVREGEIHARCSIAPRGAER